MEREELVVQEWHFMLALFQVLFHWIRVFLVG
jgi:hypothetical protein